jgi:hypothetical protein
MKDKEPKLNASGYYDEPCYHTIKAMDVPQAGEIWTHNQSGTYMLVMANDNGVCPTLRLNEQQKDGCIPVTCRVPMYANPAFVGYGFESNLAQYIKTVKEDEFQAVKQRFADMLGIESYIIGIDPGEHINVNIHNEQVKALEEERDKLRGVIGELKSEMDLMLKENEARDKAHTLLSESLDKVSREADKAEIYKEMYMTLLDKVISARGGSVNE